MDSDTKTLIVAIISILVFILLVIPYIVIFWTLVKKAGKNGWSQLIPAYNSYVLGLVAKKPKLAIATFIVYGIWLIFNYFVAPEAGITTVLGFTSLILQLIILRNFITQYDAGLGKWVLFVLVPIVGAFFAKDTKYIGGEAPTPVQPTAPAVGTPAVATDVTAQPVAPATQEPSSQVPPSTPPTV